VIGQLGVESEEPFHGLDFTIFEPVEKIGLTVQRYVHSLKVLARCSVLCWYQGKLLSARDILQVFHFKIVSSGLVLPNMTDIVCSIADLVRHASKLRRFFLCCRLRRVPPTSEFAITRGIFSRVCPQVDRRTPSNSDLLSDL
jgi:hypothetical protein